MKSAILTTMTTMLLATSTMAAIVEPSARQATYHDVYSGVADTYRDLDLSGLDATFCRTAGSVACVTNETVTVKHAPDADVHGCQQLVSFYVQVRNAKTASIPAAIRALETNTGTQEELENLRKEVEEAQHDAYNVQEFCGDLAAAVRVHRNTFHAYTSAWAAIKFGDSTLDGARRLRSGSTSHQDVVLQALGSMEHEPEVTLKLLE